jgi:hypothetical protein
VVDLAPNMVSDGVRALYECWNLVYRMRIIKTTCSPVRGGYILMSYFLAVVE